MIAEIKGKISNTGSNLNDRLEDNLTGNVFGTLRYISFEKGLKKILIESISPKNSKAIDIIKNINVEGWDSNISFWPYDKEGELDVLLEFDSCIIGIEVKYLSGISSDDGITNEIILSKNEEKESIQQLARESRIISKKAVNREKILIFIADQQCCIDVYKDVCKRNIIKDDVNLVYISWQKILDTLQHLKMENEYEKLMVSDLISLLTKKGFEQFKDFLIEKKSKIRHNYSIIQAHITKIQKYIKSNNIQKAKNQIGELFMDLPELSEIIDLTDYNEIKKFRDIFLKNLKYPALFGKVTLSNFKLIDTELNKINNKISKKLEEFDSYLKTYQKK